MKVSQELSISFWLRRNNKNPSGKATIMLRIIMDGERDGFSLGYKVEPEKFDHKAGMISGKSPEVIEINKYLLKVRTGIMEHYNRLKDKGLTVTPTSLKNAYLGLEKKTLLQVFDFHNERFAKKVAEGKRSPETMKKWESTKDKVKAFLLKTFKKEDVSLERLEYYHAEDFFDYLTLEDKLQDNTAMKHIKNTKQILGIAVTRKWLQASPWEDYACSYIDPERDILNMEELSILYHKQMAVPRLQEAKDAYLFMALTGYAYKDAFLLEPGNVTRFFDGEVWIVKNREKTWCRENVPLLPIAKEIIRRYKDHPRCVAANRLLPINSNQRFNGYLKEIADICGIRKNLTTHTARHTFATTVTLANGVPIETVSSLLGHRSLRTTQIYAKIVARKVGQDMKNLSLNFSLDLPESFMKPLAA